ncbi:MAG: hypothetical protein K9M54_00950 [Kiritimatiellales bacterium]|nr:hypothetical protein [Kiritimatiellales bacterium]
MKKPFVKESRARWIWSTEQTHLSTENHSPSHYEVRRFRRTFELDSTRDISLHAAVTADSRYILYCNGTLVSRGPAKGDVEHRFYSTADLTPHLRTGKNVMAALIMDFSKVACHPPELGAPCWSINHSGGFLLESDGPLELSTGKAWKIQVDQAFSFHNEGCPHGGFVGYFERFDTAAEPAGWTLPDFDDSGWDSASELYPPVRIEDYRDAPSPYGLVEAIVPLLDESEPLRFKSVFLPGGGEAPAKWQQWIGGVPVTVPANSRVEIILDAGALQSGFPVLATSGGKSAKVQMMYAEGLRLPWSVEDANILGRGIDTTNVSTMNSSEQAGWTLDRRGTLAGWFDEITLSGGEHAYEPFHWRTFQFVKLTVETSVEPLTIQPLTYRFTAYPFQKNYAFQCSDDFFQSLEKISWHTFRLCTHETFEDCPYYEQMQYSGDSQITSLIALAATGDARLTKQALYQFSWSLRPEGITECRYPATLPVVIPSWSLHYILMIADYFDYTGDTQTIRDLLPCIRSILDWFDRHKDETGLPAKLPHWNTVDWSPRWDRGCPPGWDRGPTCIISSQYLRALRVAAKFDKSTSHYAEEAKAVAQKINDLFWNEKRGLYEDCPGGPDASQYGNAWAVHSGAATPERAARAMDAALENRELDPASFFGMYFVVRALEDCGQYSRFPQLLGRWQEMIDCGFSTWAEDITYWRSLCHAWSAFPAIEFLRGVLGVKPGKPGFEEILVQPQPLHLYSASGKVPTPHGAVSSAWKIENGVFSIATTAPAGVPLRIILPDGSVHRTTTGTFNGTCAI